MEIELEKLPHELTVCKVAAEDCLNLRKTFYFIAKTKNELSLVCRTEDTPENTLAREDHWKGFVVRESLDFSLIGILSGITGVLAENRIGVFAVSTYDTDYILVKEDSFDRAARALEDAGYTIYTPSE
mgnify:CR=1 FL=1